MWYSTNPTTWTDVEIFWYWNGDCLTGSTIPAFRIIRSTPSTPATYSGSFVRRPIIPPKHWRWFDIFRSTCESVVKLVSPPLLIIRPLQLMVAAMQRRRHKRKRAVQRLNRT